MKEALEHFFKPELRRAANDLIQKKAVYLQIGTDRQVGATVRGTTSAKVGFRSDSIVSQTFTVDCSCKVSKKGQFCKHIWAVLELASEKQPDFFELKTEIIKADFITESAAQKKPPETESSIAYKEKLTARRKEAHEEQKQRAKNIKADRKSRDQKESIKSSAFSRALPDDVKAALSYFEVNGFPMTLPVEAADVDAAKRVLSRVFHPDKGGSQDEMLELLRNADALVKFRF